MCASDGGVCLASDGQVAWVNHTTLLCPALRLELTLGALPSDAWQPLLLSLFNFDAWLRAKFGSGLRFFFLGGAGNTLALPRVSQRC